MRFPGLRELASSRGGTARPRALSETMSSAQFSKAAPPHSYNTSLRRSASIGAGAETTFVESHERRTGERVCRWKTHSCQLSAAAATGRYEGGVLGIRKKLPGNDLREEVILPLFSSQEAAQTQASSSPLS